MPPIERSWSIELDGIKRLEAEACDKSLPQFHNLIHEQVKRVSDLPTPTTPEELSLRKSQRDALIRILGALSHASGLLRSHAEIESLMLDASSEFCANVKLDNSASDCSRAFLDELSHLSIEHTRMTIHGGAERHAQ